MEAEYQRNIFNAYFLFKYKIAQKEPLRWEYTFMTYFVMLLQLVSLFLLARLIMLQSGVSISQRDVEADERSLIVFPFLVIGLFAGLFEVISNATDLSMFTADAAFPSGSKAFVHMCFFWILRTVTAMGVFGYFTVISLYATQDWDGVLNTILNILAYQFILSLDEWALTFAEGGFRNALIRNESTLEYDDVFKGTYSGGQSSEDWCIMHFGNTIACAMILYRIYSGIEWVLWVAIVFVVALWARGFLVTYIEEAKRLVTDPCFVRNCPCFAVLVESREKRVESE